VKHIPPMRSEVIWMKWWLREVARVVLVRSEVNCPTTVKLSGL
jgi:hypothetical protein